MEQPVKRITQHIEHRTTGHYFADIIKCMNSHDIFPHLLNKIPLTCAPKCQIDKKLALFQGMPLLECFSTI